LEEVADGEALVAILPKGKRKKLFERTKLLRENTALNLGWNVSFEMGFKLNPIDIISLNEQASLY